jgi:membrane-associated HD superfamily phosphohydrolase
MNMMTDRLRNSVKDSAYIVIAKKILSAFVRENLIYNKELTDLEIQNKIEKIPNTIGIVKGNERIVSKHDPINRNTKLKLDSYKKVRLEKLGVEDYFRSVHRQSTYRSYSCAAHSILPLLHKKKYLR